MDKKRKHNLRTVTRKISTRNHTITKAPTTALRIHHTKRVHVKNLKKGFMSHLEIYAFWTGVASTLISLVQVMLLTK